MSRTIPRSSRAAVIFFLAAFAAVLVRSAAAEQISTSGDQPRIVNGVTSHGYPTTGALLFGANGASAGVQCSGTLIGCRTFLTAAHCVVGDRNPAHYFVYLQHAGVFSVTSVVPNNDYRDDTFPLSDVAVLKLGSLVTGITPTAVNLTDPEPFIPHAATIVGFGQTLGSAGDYGIKRAGAVQTVSCNGSSVPSGATNDDVVCWAYTAPVGPPGADSNTCNGDSGGPLFMDLGSGEVVAGTTSGGNSATCDVGDFSYDANVFAYGAFILDRLGTDSTSACGPIPVVGSGDVSVVGNDGTLSTGNLSDSYSVDISSPTNVLRFVLNGEDNGILDADLYVRRGAPATTTNFDCKADGPGNFGACEFTLPAIDTWHVLVQRGGGQGDYQLTTTIIGGPAPVCGNDVTETGETCDGTDDANCAGLCNGATCACPPPSCGNDVAEAGEECDGSSTGACLGPCEVDCTCAGVCGDGVCQGGEGSFSCPQDCGCAAAGSCAFGQAPANCYCDDLCTSFGDCCPDACVTCDVCEAGCGNGVLEIGEQCDDGNLVAGDCCSPSCSFETAGSGCDDGSQCTVGDQCNGAGACVGNAQLQTSCFAAGKASLKVDDKGGIARDRLKWSWLKGQEVTIDDLGTPDTTTGYELCVFDTVGAQAELAISARSDPGPLWELKPGKFWTLSNSSGNPQGVQKLRLSVGGDGFAKVKLRAGGTHLVLPGPVSPGYFTMEPKVVVQLSNRSGKCWTSEFSNATRSDAEGFSAKLP